MDGEQREQVKKKKVTVYPVNGAVAYLLLQEKFSDLQVKKVAEDTCNYIAE